MKSTKKFIQLGLAALTLSFTFQANALAHTDNHDHNIEQVKAVKLADSAASDVKNHFNVDAFMKKYHLQENPNINIKPIYIKDGQSINWVYSTAFRDENGNQQVVLILDKNGDLYGLDKDFTGKHQLSQTEKDLLKEHTLLHELSHAYTAFDSDLFKSSKLSGNDNKDINDMLLLKMKLTGLYSVFNESNAAANATSLLIQHNANNIDAITTMIKKKNIRDTSANKKQTDSDNFVGHIMIPRVERQVLNETEKLINFSQEEVFNNSKIIASDITLNYLSEYGKMKLYNFNGKDMNYIEMLEQKDLIKEDLLVSIQQSAQGKSSLTSQDTNLFKNYADKIVKNYPDLSNERFLINPTFFYESTAGNIISENTNTVAWGHAETKVRDNLPNKSAYDNDFNHAVEAIFHSKENLNAKKIIKAFVDNTPYQSNDVIKEKSTEQKILAKYQPSNIIDKMKAMRVSNKSNITHKQNIP